MIPDHLCDLEMKCILHTSAWGGILLLCFSLKFKIVEHFDIYIHLNRWSNVYCSDYSCKTTEIIIDGSRPLWHHYFLCGYRGIVDHYQLEAPKGMELLVDGTIPHSAGLSSSSALVCCAALATSRCNGKEPSKVKHINDI